MKEEPQTSTSSQDSAIAATPIQTGAEGNQEPASPEAALVPTRGSTPFDQSHLGAALGEHLDARSSPVNAIAVAAFRDAHLSREILRQQLDRVSDDRDEMREKYHDAEKRAAIFETENRLANRWKKLQRWTFGLGGVLAGTALGLALQAPTGRPTITYMILCLVGLVVMWIGSSSFEGKNREWIFPTLSSRILKSSA